MHGLVMDLPLHIPGMLEHGGKYQGDTKIGSRPEEGGIHRHIYRRALLRTRRLANAIAL